MLGSENGLVDAQTLQHRAGREIPVSWIAGIDYSTRAIDVVYIDEDDLNPPYWERYVLEGQDAWERTRQVKGWSLELAADTLAVGLEQPRGHGAGALYRVQGAILTRLPAGVLVQPWLPSEWRKRAGLKGNAGKQDSVRASLELGGGDDGSIWLVDAHEAHLIAVATRAAIQAGAA
jgi:hypothetical protein